MNFYLLQDDQATSALLRDLIENDFDNTLVGLTADPNRAYEELLQLRVDIMILPYQPHGMDGVELIYRLQQVNNHPHFIMVGPPTPPPRRPPTGLAVTFTFLTPQPHRSAPHHSPGRHPRPLTQPGQPDLRNFLLFNCPRITDPRLPNAAKWITWTPSCAS